MILNFGNNFSIKKMIIFFIVILTSCSLSESKFNSGINVKKRYFGVAKEDLKHLVLPTKKQALENKKRILNFLEEYNLSPRDLIKFKDKYYNHYVFFGVGILPKKFKHYTKMSPRNFFKHNDAFRKNLVVDWKEFLQVWKPSKIYPFRNWDYIYPSTCLDFRPKLKPEILVPEGWSKGKKGGDPLTAFSFYKYKAPYLFFVSDVIVSDIKNKIPKEIIGPGYNRFSDFISITTNDVMVSIKFWVKIDHENPYKGNSGKSMNWELDPSYDANAVIFFCFYYDEPVVVTPS